MDVLINSKRIRLTSSKIIGSGGEAEIFDVGRGQVAKIFKLPTHADYEGNVNDQKMAKLRISEHQTKLRMWPKKLPKEVTGPISLVTDLSGQNVLGYTMKFLSGMEVLLKYGERNYREGNGIGNDQILSLYKHMHALVAGVHNEHVVIGDFNDLNVLVDTAMKAYLVDADSMQFGGYRSGVFTARFVDPLLCDVVSSHPNLIASHTVDSDWYAYAVMLMQSLLFVGPYGGVHIPSIGVKKLKEWERVQKRITVFSSEVRYPKPALHYSLLPDDLLEVFHRIFEKDIRGVFPIDMLRELRFTTCPVCKNMHARISCPHCQTSNPSTVKVVVTAHVEAMKILDTSGSILYTTVEDGVIRYVYHENGAYYREGSRKIVDGKKDAGIRFRINNNATILARDGQGIVLEEGGQQKKFLTDLFRGKVATVDANKKFIVTIVGSHVRKFTRDDMEYPVTLGEVLEGQTLIWVSDILGFIYSGAGGICQSYVFRTDGSSLGQEVDLGKMPSTILDATAVFSKTHVWFMIAFDALGNRSNRAYMFDHFGKLCGQTETISGDGSWLGSIRGKCAYGAQLFSPTDNGIERVEAANGSLGVTKVFTETTRFVDSSSKLLFGKDGIYVVTQGRIWRLQMK